MKNFIFQNLKFTWPNLYTDSPAPQFLKDKSLKVVIRNYHQTRPYLVEISVLAIIRQKVYPTTPHSGVVSYIIACTELCGHQCMHQYTKQAQVKLSANVAFYDNSKRCPTHGDQIKSIFFVFKEHLAMKQENFTGTISASWQIRKIVACTYVARLFFSSLKPGAPHGQIHQQTKIFLHQ